MRIPLAFLLLLGLAACASSSSERQDPDEERGESRSERERERAEEREREGRGEHEEEGESAPLTFSELRMPQPTDQGMLERVERNGEEREAWIERMHRAADGVDWHAIEAENRRREEARRVRMAQQQQQHATAPPTDWGEVGSRNQCGRIHVVARLAGATASSPLWIGADLGGVWRRNASGTGWTPKSDDLYGGAAHLVIVPTDIPGGPDVVLQVQDGGRVRVSRDDGATWTAPTGLPALSSCRGAGSLADANATILVYGQFPSGGTRPGVFASVDRGRTFSNRWTGTQNFAGWMWVPRKAPFAATQAYLVQRGVLWASTDGAASFQARGTIDATATRAILTGSEGGAPTLYAAIESAAGWRLHRSDDAGATWAFVSAITDLWDGTLCASTVDPMRVTHGGLEAWRSADGGVTFTRVNTWGAYYGDPAHKLHADLPGIFCWPDPAGGERWYFGTDGGLFESTDAGVTVNNLTLTGIGTSQYYSSLTSRANADRIQAGAQDQGYQRGLWQPPTGSGPSTDFAQLISGDYGHLTSSNGTHNLVYSTYPGFVLIAEGETNPTLRTADFPAGSSHDWLPMVVADPANANSFFLCAEKLYRYDRSGNTWTPVQHTPFDFRTGGASFLTALAFAPSNPQRVYAANDHGRMFTSTNHGATWVESANVGPNPHYFYGAALAVNPTDPLEATAGGSGYSAPGVKRTTDGGATWTALTSGLPATHTYDLAYAEDGSGDVYAATEAGAWRHHRANGAWVDAMQLGTPITLYWSVECVPSRGLMRFGTYARGIWDYRIPPVTPVARWVRYGENLGGANVLDLNGSTPPSIGTTSVLDIAAPDQGERTGWILHSYFGGSAPFAGGTLLADPIAYMQRLRIEHIGTGTARFAIPNDPFLIGTSHYLQAALVDPNQPGGIALSNGLEAQIGP